MLWIEDIWAIYLPELFFSPLFIWCLNVCLPSNASHWHISHAFCTKELTEPHNACSPFSYSSDLGMFHNCLFLVCSRKKGNYVIYYWRIIFNYMNLYLIKFNEARWLLFWFQLSKMRKLHILKNSFKLSFPKYDISCFRYDCFHSI